MAAISAALVKELRERTGLGMLDCKKALAATDGDMEAAIEQLRKDGALKAAKKSGRTAAEGLLGFRVADDGARAVVCEVNIETDFAAKNEKFVEFVGAVTDAVFDGDHADVQALLDAGFEARREELVQGIGENVTIRRFERVSAPDGGVVAGYLHGTNRLAAIVALSGGDVDLARDVAMHVTASSPQVVAPDDVPAETLDKEREIFTAQAAESGKPPEIIDKMIEGRLRKFRAEVSLIEQPFVKDPDQTVGKLLKSKGAGCVSFIRYEVGEGIEKDETDFAAEVAAQVEAAR